MGHIELIGPPGSGKSSIYKNVIQKEFLFGGINENAIDRLLAKKSNKMYTSLWNAFPNFLKSIISKKFLYYRFSSQAERDFIKSNPDYLYNLLCYCDPIDGKGNEIINIGLKYLRWYQLGLAATNKDEILCLDGGFGQVTVSSLMRSSTNSFPDEYYKTFPKPLLIIYVYADPETCVERQKSRGNIIFDGSEVSDVMTKQKYITEICDTVASEADENEIPVCKISNNGGLDGSINNVLNVINSLV